MSVCFGFFYFGFSWRLFILHLSPAVQFLKGNWLVAVVGNKAGLLRYYTSEREYSALCVSRVENPFCSVILFAFFHKEMPVPLIQRRTCVYVFAPLPSLCKWRVCLVTIFET